MFNHAEVVGIKPPTPQLIVMRTCQSKISAAVMENDPPHYLGPLNKVIKRLRFFAPTPNAHKIHDNQPHGSGHYSN